MKIERLNDHQFRCTLSNSDLKAFDIELSDLAYTTPRARDLFNKMIKIASENIGFDLEDKPLFIEAVPKNADCLVLIVTKVNNPEEMDSRFSKFTRSAKEAPNVPYDHDPTDTFDDAEEPNFADFLPDEPMEESILNSLTNLFEAVTSAIAEKAESKKEANHHSAPIQQTSGDQSTKNSVEIPADELNTHGNITANMNLHVFDFDSLSQICTVAQSVGNYELLDSSIYKDPKTNKYILIAQPLQDRPMDNSVIITTILEYGSISQLKRISFEYLNEYYIPIIKHNALQQLSQL